MSTRMDINREIMEAERQIDDQIRKFHDYTKQIDTVMSKVQAAFGGSSDRYSQNMIQQLQTTKEKVNKAVDMLTKAKDKLLIAREL